MEGAENQIQKHLVSFCKCLPGHVECWKSVLQQSAKPLHNLSNLSEQRRHVARANISYVDDFKEIQATLLYQISNRIEEEIVKLKELIDKLNNANYDLKNKLLAFERSTLNVDWEENSELITGNGTQPSLARLLGNGLDFLSFFLEGAKNVSEHFKALNVDDEGNIKALLAAFDVKIDDKIVVNLLALTQYVDNEKLVC